MEGNSGDAPDLLCTDVSSRLGPTRLNSNLATREQRRLGEVADAARNPAQPNDVGGSCKSPFSVSSLHRRGASARFLLCRFIPALSLTITRFVVYIIEAVDSQIGVREYG